MSHKVRVLFTEFVTHDVKSIIVERPENYTFVPGQSTDVAVNKTGWEDEKRAFCFTSQPDDAVLQFTIKIYPVAQYPEHTGVTEEIGKLVPGDELLIDEPFDSIVYKEKGVFIAGGAGITPVLSIIRNLYRTNRLDGNSLIYSNNTQQDIIRERELLHMFDQDPNRIKLLLSKEAKPGYLSGRIDKAFLAAQIQDFDQYFYLCGPDPMIASLRSALLELGADETKLIS